MEIPNARKLDISTFIGDVIIPTSKSRRRLCFILGSGASKTSGVPTGGELEMKWMDHMMNQPEDYRQETQAAAERLKNEGKLSHDYATLEHAWLEAKDAGKTVLSGEYYFDIFTLRFRAAPGDGIQELQDCMRGCIPGVGYFVLSQLMTYDGCRNNVVITTNFDSLVEKALFAFTEETPVTVPHEKLLDSFSWDGAYPVIAKVHRDLMFSPLNSARDVKALKKQWKRLLRRILESYVPIVIGYAGADDSLMRFMEERGTQFPNGLYWCYREKGEKPSDRVIQLVKRKKGFFVPVEGFDELMVRLSLYEGPYTNPVPHDALDALEKRYGNIVREFKKKQNKIGSAKPHTAQDYFNRAYRHAEEGRYKEAIADYTEAITYKPDYTDAYNNRGNAYRHQGDYKAAIADYDRAIALKPDYAYAYNNRGYAYDDLGDYKAAIADYDRAIELKPDYAYAYYNRGNACAAQGDYKAAIADYDRAIALKPDDAYAYNNRGCAYDDLGDYKAAIADYNRAIARKPDFALAYNNRGNAYYDQGDYKAAIADYNKAIARKPDDAKAYNNRGNAYRKLGDCKAAIADYDRAIELKPDYTDAYNNRGCAYDNLGDYKSAIADYNKAIALKPDDAYAYNNRGCAYRNLGDYKAAEADFAKAHELDPKNY